MNTGILNKMKILKQLVFLSFLFFALDGKAQWSNKVQLSDLNTWSSQSGFIGWYETSNNVPPGQHYGNGIQLSLPQDPSNGAQIVIPTFDAQIFFRRNMSGSWDPWYKVWSSNNLNKNDVDFACKNMRCYGNLWAQEIKVSISNPWPDYVFTPDYKLPSLKETEKQIEQQGHLPGIPSAAEVKANGIDLGEMNAKLLQKIEELTLYLIKQDKKIEEFDRLFKELKSGQHN